MSGRTFTGRAPSLPAHPHSGGPCAAPRDAARRRLAPWLWACAAAVLASGCSATPARQPATSSGATPSSSAAAPANPLALDAVLALNPALNGNGYALRAGPEPGLSVWAATRPGFVELVVNAARTVVAIRGVFPTSTGLQPWYDQARGGVVGAQTGAQSPAGQPSRVAPYRNVSGPTPSNASNPAAVIPNQASPVGLGSSANPPASPASGTGRAPTASGTTVSTVYTETLWLVPRNQATAGPTVLPQYTTVAGLNPAMSRTRAQTDFLPGSGVLYGPQRYGLLAAVDRGGRLAGVIGWFPLGAGWQPFDDQIPGHEDIVATNFLRGFTERVWLEAPAGIR